MKDIIVWKRLTYWMKRNVHEKLEMKLILLLISIFLGSANGDLSIAPRDTESMIGQLSYLNCSLSNPTTGKEIHWYHNPVDKPDERSFVYGYNRFYTRYENRFQMERNVVTGAFNIIIPSVLPEDAGRYECIDDSGLGNRSSAELIVLNDVPTCMSNMMTDGVVGPNSCGIEPDELSLSCQIPYYGNVAPKLKWSRKGRKDPITEGVTIENPVNSTIYTLYMKGDLSLDNSAYICETTRSTGEQHKCTSDVIKILYAFNNLSLSNRIKNESVQCSANSSQSCSYRWKWYDGNREVLLTNNDPDLILERSGLYNCEADCNLRGKTCTVIASVVHVNEDSSCTSYNSSNAGFDTGKGVLLAILLIVIACIFIAGLVLFFRKRSQNRSRKNGNIEIGATDPLLTESRDRIKELEARQTEDAALIKHLEDERKKLILRRRELGQLLYQPRRDNLDYTLKTAGPKTTQTSARDMKSVAGLAIVDTELFIVSQASSDIEIYEATSFKYLRGWALNGLKCAEDMAGCPRKRFLYLSDSKTEEDELKEIFQVDPNGNLIKKWSTGDACGRLSVTDDCNIILTVRSLNKLQIYNSEGGMVSEIMLKEMNNPLHAVKLATGHIVVSHGFDNDTIHGVCIVDIDGEKIKSFGRRKGSAIGEMNGPISLAVDEEGSIIVADCGNSRLLLLSSILEYKGVIESDDSFGFPVRICLNLLNGRMFVADLQNANRRLMVFDINRPGLPAPASAMLR